MNILFQELETHAWRDGIIVDLGKHNDAAMAFAHAVDQLQIPQGNVAVAMGSLSGGEWIGGDKRNAISRRGSTGIGGVTRRRRV